MHIITSQCLQAITRSVKTKYLERLVTLTSTSPRIKENTNIENKHTRFIYFGASIEKEQYVNRKRKRMHVD